MSFEKKWAAVVSNQAITIVDPDNGPTTIQKTHPNFQAAKDAVQRGLYKAALTLAQPGVNTANKLKATGFFGERVEFDPDSGQVLVSEKPLPSIVADTALRMIANGQPLTGLAAFLSKLRLNPSNHSQHQLLTHVEKHGLAITDNGDFLAYKRVDGRFKDLHSGTFDNTPGKSVTMPRTEVNDDPTVTCSHGLHVASWKYANEFYASRPGARTVVVAVDPAAVVAVPKDYDEAKMRTCAYRVLREVTSPYNPDGQVTVDDYTRGYQKGLKDCKEQ